MEALYLLATVAATATKSAALSLLLVPRLLLAALVRPFRRPADGGTQPQPVRLYEGRVRHVRRHPAVHAFEYPVRYALIDLDSAPQRGHLSAGEAREVVGTDGSVFLLTIPKNVGYEQNPLSIYYCYDRQKSQNELENSDKTRERKPGQSGGLKMSIAEVTNTPWGERVIFTFQPGVDVVAKPLHVSPFMDMLGSWQIITDEPGENLAVTITINHPDLGNYFNASLRAKAVGYSDNATAALDSFFWLMPHKVAVWIYWEALRLLSKNVKFLDHPKFLKPNYRDEAVRRDLQLRHTCTGFCGKNNSSSHSSIQTGYKDNTYCSKRTQNRRFSWTDASWPWA